MSPNQSQIAKLLPLMLMNLFLLSCSEDSGTGEPKEEPKIERSDEKEILSFTIGSEAVVHEAEIKNDSIVAVLPSSVNLGALAPEIVVSDKAKVSPASGVPQDFGNVVRYTVTAEDSSAKSYRAFITKMSSENTIHSFSFTNLPAGVSNHRRINKNPQDIDTLSFNIPHLSPVKGLTSFIELPEKATIEPKSGETLDYSQPVTYTVTAEDGSQKQYLVMVGFNALGQVKIDGILGDQYRNKIPNGAISFTTNVLHPVQDSIRVQLLSSTLPDIVYELEVQNVNYDNNEVHVVLPGSYSNGLYYFKTYLEHDNFDESDGFYLDSGTPYFLYVKDKFLSTAEYHTYKTLLMPGEIFEANMFLNPENFEGHDFYLRKDHVDYPLSDPDSYNWEVARFYMPDLPDSGPTPTGGTGYEFVIAYEGQQYAFPLVNTNNESIEILVAEPPIVDSLSATAVEKEGTLTVFGSNLYYPYIAGKREVLSSVSKLRLDVAQGSYSLHQIGLDNDGSMTFSIPEWVVSGTYNVVFKSNVGAFEMVDTGFTVTVELPESEHPKLEVTEALIYSNTSSLFPKQIRIKFNADISEITIKKIILGDTFTNLTIENFIFYPSSIMTGSLSDEDHYHYWGHLFDGYVLLEDQGTEYKLPFKLARAN